MLALLALAWLAGTARAQDVEPRSEAAGTEGPRSFAEHFARRASLTEPLVRVRAFPWGTADAVRLAPTCTTGEPPRSSRLVSIVDADGRPARGAVVIAQQDTASRPTFAGVADDDGIVRPALGARDVLRVELDGHLPVAGVRANEDVHLDLALVRGVELVRRRVLDERGEPVIDAEVALDTSSGTWRAWSDSLGQYRILAAEPIGLPRDLSFHVSALGHGFLGQGRAFALERASGTEPVEITVHRLRTLDFDVVDARGDLVLDASVRIAWDRVHARRFEFSHGAPSTVRALAWGPGAGGREAPGIGIRVRDVPPGVPLWVEVARADRVLGVEPLEIPLDRHPPLLRSSAAPRVVITVRGDVERVPASLFRVVDPRGRPRRDVSAVLVRTRDGRCERVALDVDDLARVRVDAQETACKLEIHVSRTLLLSRAIPAQFDSAEIVELVVDAR